MPLNPKQRDLVENYIPMVHNYLRAHVSTPPRANRDREYADLFQEGCLGLMTAAQAFRPQRDGSFGSFALPRIRLAVHRALHERFATVRIPPCLLQKREPKREKSSPDSSPDNGPSSQNSSSENPAESLAGPTRPTAANVVRLLRDADEIYAKPSGDPFCREMPNPQTTANTQTIAARIEFRIRLVLEAVRREYRRRNANYPKRMAMVDRIIHDRLLIPEAEERQSLRDIGRIADLTGSQVWRYERRLLDKAREYLKGDAEFRALLKLSRKHEGGFHAILSPQDRAALKKTALPNAPHVPTIATRIPSSPSPERRENRPDMKNTCETKGSRQPLPDRDLGGSAKRSRRSSFGDSK